MSTPEQEQILHTFITSILDDLYENWDYYADDRKIPHEIILTAMVIFLRVKANELSISVDNLKTAIDTAAD